MKYDLRSKAFWFLVNFGRLVGLLTLLLILFGAVLWFLPLPVQSHTGFKQHSHPHQYLSSVFSKEHKQRMKRFRAALKR